MKITITLEDTNEGGPNSVELTFDVVATPGVDPENALTPASLLAKTAMAAIAADGKKRTKAIIGSNSFPC